MIPALILLVVSFLDPRTGQTIKSETQKEKKTAPHPVATGEGIVMLVRTNEIQK